MRTGNVVGSLPDGDTSPLQHVGERVAPLLARRTSTAGSRRRRRPTASSTGDAAFTTTTVRGFAAATARTSSSCGGGSAIDSRSLPSVSQSLSVPTTHTTASARARERDRALDEVGAAPAAGTRSRARRAPARPGRTRRRASCGSPATSSIVPVDLRAARSPRTRRCARSGSSCRRRPRRRSTSRARPTCTSAERPLARLGRDDRAVHAQRELVGHPGADRTDEREAAALRRPRRAPARLRARGPRSTRPCSGPSSTRVSSSGVLLEARSSRARARSRRRRRSGRGARRAARPADAAAPARCRRPGSRARCRRSGRSPRACATPARAGARAARFCSSTKLSRAARRAIVAVDRIVDATPPAGRSDRRARPVRSSSASTRRTLSSSALLVDLARRAPRRASFGAEPLRRARASRGRARRSRPARCCACRTSPTSPRRRSPTRRAAASSSHGVLAAVRAVQAVVRGHHRPRARLAHRGLERRRARSRAACARRPRS